MKKIKTLKTMAAFTLAIAMSACGGDAKDEHHEKAQQKNEVEEPMEEIAEEITEETVATETSSTEDFMANKGVGPIKSIELEDIDEALVEKGKEIFKANCTACHKFEKRVVGPPLAGIMQRRSPEWIMNMILNPENMVENDPDAKALLEEYLSPMANQNLTEDEARAILELFRTKN